MIRGQQAAVFICMPCFHLHTSCCGRGCRYSRKQLFELDLSHGIQSFKDGTRLVLHLALRVFALSISSVSHSKQSAGGLNHWVSLSLLLYQESNTLSALLDRCVLIHHVQSLVDVVHIKQSHLRCEWSTCDQSLRRWNLSRLWYNHTPI